MAYKYSLKISTIQATSRMICFTDKGFTSGTKTNIFMDCFKMEQKSLEILQVPKSTIWDSSKTAKR